MRVVDLFCGAGGFAVGLKRAGLEIVKSLDFDLAALAVHSANLEPKMAVALNPVAMNPPRPRGQKRPPKRGTLSDSGRVVDHADLGDILSYAPEMATIRPDVIVGGPPCQPYSKAGKQLGDGDWKSGLTDAFAMMVSAGRPTYFIMENVPQVAKSRAYKRAKAIFQAAGYGITETVLDSSFYGTPQARQRWICAGALSEADGWLLPYIQQYQSARRLTVGDVFGAEFGVTLDDIVISGRERVAKVEPERYGDEPKHTRLKDRDIEFVLEAAPGERFYFCRPGGEQTGSIRAVSLPAPTITGKSTQGVGRNYQPRPHDWIDLNALPHPTFEQFSELGGFPADWQWDVPGYQARLTHGARVESKAPTKTQVRQMLGNAVAPPLAECLGRALLDHQRKVAPGARSSKALREGTGKAWEDKQKAFDVPEKYREHLTARGLATKVRSQELSNLRRAKREVAVHGLTSARDEVAALDSVLRLRLAHLGEPMKSSLRRALRDYADWEDEQARIAAARKRTKLNTRLALDDETARRWEEEERAALGAPLPFTGPRGRPSSEGTTEPA
jgi:site-specific DNA-cytosine methylase